MLYFTLLFTISGLHWETTFNVLYSLFLFSLVIYMYLIDKHQYNLKIPKHVVNYGWKGVKYILVSSLFWIITEMFCGYLNIFKYVFGHVWWHIFVSLGGYFISLIPVYLMLRQNNYEKIIVLKLDNGFLPYVDYY